MTKVEEYFDADVSVDFHNTTGAYNACGHNAKIIRKCYLNLNNTYNIWVPTLSRLERNGEVFSVNAYENYLSDDKEVIKEICPEKSNFEVGTISGKKLLAVFMKMRDGIGKNVCQFVGIFKEAEIKRNEDGRKVVIYRRIMKRIAVKELYPENQQNSKLERSFENSERNKPMINGTFIRENKNLRNRIIFGAPGTGKSFKLKTELSELNEEQIEHITFYPDYTYGQFVGSYKPVGSSGDKQEGISYKYVPGPFMRILSNALNNIDKDYVLVIDEINRAQPAAVFGDVFQLLDRDPNGTSEYKINAPEEVREYLKNQTDKEYKKLFIPANMYIWATMNSADQGVFPIDTAFKRRWSFEYIGIDEGENGLKGKYSTQWNTVRKKINTLLLETCNVNEDKLMGPFFLKPEDLQDLDTYKKAFKFKVLMYLFEDAGRMHRAKLFKENRTLSNLMKCSSTQIFKDDDIIPWDENIPTI